MGAKKNPSLLIAWVPGESFAAHFANVVGLPLMDLHEVSPPFGRINKCLATKVTGILGLAVGHDVS